MKDYIKDEAINELLKKVRLIQLKSRKIVNEVLAGEYLSVFKGRGIEFDEVREYVPGDDIRFIDWNVTARTGIPHVKKYIEERELSVIFVADVSSSFVYGSGERQKNWVMAELCSLLAFSAIENKDKVGIIMFSDKVEKYIPPKKGKKHILRVIREILAAGKAEIGEKKRTKIANVLDFVASVIKKKSVVFLISDFIDSGYIDGIKVLGKKHDFIAVRIFDKNEDLLPRVGCLGLVDPETGDAVEIDSSDKKFLSYYNNVRMSDYYSLKKLADVGYISFIEVESNEDYLKKLIMFFKMREKLMTR